MTEGSTTSYHGFIFYSAWHKWICCTSECIERPLLFDGQMFSFILNVFLTRISILSVLCSILETHFRGRWQRSLSCTVYWMRHLIIFPCYQTVLLFINCVLRGSCAWVIVINTTWFHLAWVPSEFKFSDKQISQVTYDFTRTGSLCGIINIHQVMLCKWSVDYLRVCIFEEPPIISNYCIYRLKKFFFSFLRSSHPSVNLWWGPSA